MGYCPVSLDEELEFLKTLFLVNLLLIIPVSIYAQEGFSVSANIGLTNDYKYYGTTFSNEEWALSGGLDIGHTSGFYLGSWASSIDFNSDASDPAQVEWHIYAGYANELTNGLGYDIGVRRYGYPGQNEDDNIGQYNYYEFIVGINYEFSGDLTPVLNGGIAISPDYFGDGGTSIYVTSGLTISLPAELSGYISYGYLNVDDINLAYSHYTLGLSRNFAGFGFDISWADADSECGGKELCQGFVFSITKEF